MELKKTENKTNEVITQLADLQQQAAPVPTETHEAILPDLAPEALPSDIPAEVKAELLEDLSEVDTEDILEDIQQAEKEEAAEAAEAAEEGTPVRDRLTKSRLLKLLIKKQYQTLRDETEEEHPADLAELLEELDENNRLVVFRLLKKEVATEAFTYMSDEAREDLVESFSDAELVNALEEMSLDDAADLLEDMPAAVVKRILAKSSRETRESLNKLLKYPEGSAGSIMTPEFVRLKQTMTVREAISAIRKQGENAETIYTSYIVEKNRLLGVVSARDLLLSDFETPITELMDDNVVCMRATDDQEEVAREMQHYDLSAMPILDSEGMLVGIVTIDDAVDVLTQESTEDMQRMAAIMTEDADASYFSQSVWLQAKQRLPWLLILMLSATVTGMVTTHYEQAFVSLPLLVSFMPMLMGTAGNCGNQTSTLMVRGLALDEVTPADWAKVLWKELRISAIVGALLGLVNAARILLMYGVFGGGQYQNVGGYALVVSLALFGAVVLAKMVGGMLPLAVKKVGLDPALMASPFITTIVDTCSLLLYFQIAMRVFAAIM
ncbi:MAG: magnesium transporter [Faecalibacterium sp.]|nr:magnesium transporter [Faecalibacterium sp.]